MIAPSEPMPGLGPEAVETPEGAAPPEPTGATDELAPGGIAASDIDAAPVQPRAGWFGGLGQRAAVLRGLMRGVGEADVLPNIASGSSIELVEPEFAAVPRVESTGAWRTARPSAAAQDAIQEQVRMGFRDQPGANVAAATAKTSRSITTAIRAQTAEVTAYDARLYRGEIGVLAPAGSNIPGPDYVTAAELPNGDYEIVVSDAKSRVSANPYGRVRSALPASWQNAISDAVSPGRLGLGDPTLEQSIRDAWAQGRVRIARDTVDYSTGVAGAGDVSLDN